MNHSHIIDRLEANAHTFRGQLEGLSSGEYQFRPAPQKWNLLEVVCHLRDEETEDFRYRVDHCLHRTDSPMPPISPVNWVSERNYAGEDYAGTLDRFLRLRGESVSWLRNLKAPDWKRAYAHPQMGSMSAELFLTNWLAHDILHLRQILSIRYRFLEQDTGIGLGYAGAW